MSSFYLYETLSAISDSWQERIFLQVITKLAVAHYDNSVALAVDPNYKQTIANNIRLLEEIYVHVEKREKTNTLAKIWFAIECFEGQE